MWMKAAVAGAVELMRNQARTTQIDFLKRPGTRSSEALLLVDETQSCYCKETYFQSRKSAVFLALRTNGGEPKLEPSTPSNPLCSQPCKRLALLLHFMDGESLLRQCTGRAGLHTFPATRAVFRASPVVLQVAYQPRVYPT